VGQGDPGRRHQAGVIRKFRSIFHKSRSAKTRLPRLLAEFIARRLMGFVESGVQIPRIAHTLPIGGFQMIRVHALRVAAVR
jgi:hypothetical protein